MAKSPNTTTAPTGNIAPFGLRMLPALKERLEAAAKASGRSMNAEVVARLQDSFDRSGADDIEWQQLESELEGERRRAERYELVAGLADTYRSLNGALLLAALQHLPPSKWPIRTSSHVMDMLATSDPRGAVFSIIQLLEADPGTLEQLRNFAGHLEDEGLDLASTVSRLKDALAAQRQGRAATAKKSKR